MDESNFLYKVQSAIYQAGLATRLHTWRVIPQSHWRNWHFISFIAPKLSHVVSIKYEYGQWILFAQLTRDITLQQTFDNPEQAMTLLKMELEYR